MVRARPGLVKRQLYRFRAAGLAGDAVSGATAQCLISLRGKCHPKANGSRSPDYPLGRVLLHFVYVPRRQALNCRRAKALSSDLVSQLSTA